MLPSAGDAVTGQMEPNSQERTTVFWESTSLRLRVSILTPVS